VCSSDLFKYSVLDRDSLTAHIGGQVDVKW
jgi:hypothetical protein